MEIHEYVQQAKIFSRYVQPSGCADQRYRRGIDHAASAQQFF